MEINWLLIAMAAVTVLCVRNGWKKGLAGGIVKIVSTVMALFILSVVILFVESIRQQDWKNIILSVIVFILCAAIQSVVMLILKSAKKVAELPIINMVNKICGAVLGAVEAVLLLWIFYLICSLLPFGQWQETIMRWTYDSSTLSRLYDMNFLLLWLV